MGRVWRRSAWRRIINAGVPEDQLTELLALVLRSDAALTREFIPELAGGGLELSANQDVDVQTQVPHGVHKIDLQLEWEDGLVWIEVKRDSLAESYPGQLSAYADLLAETAGDKPHKLVYLTRAGVRPPAGFSGEQRDWISVGEWLGSQSSGLAVELAKFLQEEGLQMRPLCPDGIAVMNEMWSVRDSMLGLLDHARPSIEARLERKGIRERLCLPKNGSLNRRAYWDYWYQAFDLTPLGWPEGILLEWNLRRRDTGQFEGRLAFAAGLTLEDPEASPADSWGDGFEDRLNGSMLNGANRFTSVAREEDRARIYRYLALEDLTAHSTIAEQADALVAFVAGAFDRILGTDPPRET